jgi:hypothetical protein
MMIVGSARQSRSACLRHAVPYLLVTLIILDCCLLIAHSSEINYRFFLRLIAVPPALSLCNCAFRVLLVGTFLSVMTLQPTLSQIWGDKGDTRGAVGTNDMRAVRGRILSFTNGYCICTGSEPAITG